MSTSPLLSHIDDTEAIGRGDTQVFHLVVLLHAYDSGTSARSANLALPIVEATTVREALQLLVREARKLIAHKLANGSEVPWIQPPEEATELESRFLVPIHL